MEKFKIIPAVYLTVIKDNKILLSLRSNTGYCDGMYSFIAGHVESNESVTCAMSREAKEEASIQIDPKDLKVLLTMHRKTPNSDWVDFFLKADSIKGVFKNMEPKKCKELKFFDLNNLPQNIVPNVLRAIECIQKKISFVEFGW